MLKRIITALIGIPLAVILIFYPNGLPFAVAIGLVSILGAHEFYSGVRKLGSQPVEWAGLAAVALFVVSARTYGPKTIGAIFPAVLTLLLILSFCVEIIRRKRAPLINVGATVFGAIYVGWLIMHLVVLRGIDGTITVGAYTKEAGAWLVMFTFLATWASDTGAYFVGRFLGKTKIAPTLSPNKTVEGSIGGFVGALILSMVAGMIIHLPWYHGLALGVIFGVLSQLGDLSESAIKREIGIKDFGNVMPGHGGILDRFDSMLFAGPAMYYYVVLFLRQWIG
ncbi:phosphatidate cytidylyltransferase [bacterium]|nr:phosphatidate cytidylyltransferase [bacterium]